MVPRKGFTRSFGALGTHAPFILRTAMLSCSYLRPVKILHCDQLRTQTLVAKGKLMQAQASAPVSLELCPRPALVTPEFKGAYSDLVQSWPTQAQLPVVYHEKYNISFFGLEKLHPFDSCKFKKVINSLIERQVIRDAQQLVTPQEASREVLADVHTPQYLEEIHTSTLRVVQVTELAPLAALPNAMLQWRVVSPMKMHVGGTMLSAGLALERGWAINIGGGMHHAYHSAGGGWCPFDDIMLAIRRLRKATQGAVQRVLYVDLDAHQGNGVERDKLHFQDQDLFIIDVYGQGMYPMDEDAVRHVINIAVPLRRGTADAEYLQKVQDALQQAETEFPNIDLVFYNAGTDVLAGDPLGRLGVSGEGVIKRDEMVWRWALEKARAPIIMTLSGGYTKQSAQIIADSITNIMNTFRLQ